MKWEEKSNYSLSLDVEMSSEHQNGKINPNKKTINLLHTEHWLFSQLSPRTKNEYFLYEQWIDNEFIQYK